MAGALQKLLTFETFTRLKLNHKSSQRQWENARWTNGRFCDARLAKQTAVLLAVAVVSDKFGGTARYRHHQSDSRQAGFAQMLP
jgi:hypothetical protein